MAEMRLDIDVKWNGDTMEIIARTMASNLSGRIESEIAQHFEVDLSDLREYIRLRQEGGEIAAVVRCRDCVNWGTDWVDRSGSGKHFCVLKGGWRSGMWFCADGERRRQE